MVFAESAIVKPFTIFTRVGHTRLDPFLSELLLADVMKACRLLVVEVDGIDDADPCCFFSKLV